MRRTVTVLFCDLCGSSRLIDLLDAELARSVLDSWWAQMSSVIVTAGGQVEKYIGDAVVGVFGVRRSRNGDAEVAVAVAAELHRQSATIPVPDGLGPLTIRVGINTGTVVVDASSPIVIGRPVHLAARLQQAASPGTTLIGPETARLISGRAAVGEPRSMILPGFVEQLLVHQVGDHRQSAEIDRAPFIGRRKELQVLHRAWAAARADHRSRTIVVTGEPGIGKTRLLDEAHAARGGQGVEFASRCMPFETRSLAPVLRMFSGAMGVVDIDSVSRRMELLAPAESTAHRFLLEACGAIPGSAGVDEACWAWSIVARAAASRLAPLVIRIDDLDYGDAAFHRWWESARRTAPPGTLFLATAKELSHPVGDSHSLLSDIALTALSVSDSVAVAKDAAGGQLSRRVLRAVLPAAAGNPLFIRELVRVADDDDSAVPATIHAAMAARLDETPIAVRPVVNALAVLGGAGDITQLRPMVGSAYDIPAAVDLLVEQHIVQHVESNGEVVFVHPMLGDVAYEELSKADRSVLHRRAADALLRNTDPVPPVDQERAGWHLHRAWRAEADLHRPRLDLAAIGARSAALLEQAAARAAARGDAGSARSALQVTLSMLEPADTVPSRLFRQLGHAQLRTADPTAARVSFHAAYDRAVAQHDEIAAARAMIGLAQLAMITGADGGMSAATALVEKSRNSLQVHRDAAGEADAAYTLGQILIFGCHAGPAVLMFQQAADLAAAAGDRAAEVSSLGSLALALPWGPVPVDEALVLCSDIEHKTSGRLAVTAGVLDAQALCEAMAGNADRATLLADREQELLEQLGNDLAAATLWLTRAEISRIAGDSRTVAVDLETGMAELLAAGEAMVLPTVAAMRAHALLDCGDQPGANRALAVALATVDDDDIASQVLCRSAQARINKDSGQAREAVVLAAHTDYLNLHAEALCQFALLCPPGLARPALSEALNLYSRKQNRPAARRTRVLLDRL